MKKALLTYIILILAVILTINYCGKKITKKTPDDKHTSENENIINETFKDTGWMSETRYRAVIFILTYEECRASTRDQIEEKIKFEAVRHLQKSLNVTFSRNQLARVKNLLDNYGILLPDEIKCSENNIFYFDIEKNDLSIEFNNIKNLK